MKINVPKVTVLMPAYNAENYIAEAINSVLQQSFTDFDLLIVNDGSSDNTENIIHSFSDERIRLINQRSPWNCRCIEYRIGPFKFRVHRPF